jgi:VWFA-related protein
MITHPQRSSFWRSQNLRISHLLRLAPALILTLTTFLEARAYAQVESNLPGAGFGQPTPAQQTTAPTIHVYSRETVIDVLATDDKGKPVTGLTRADFTIEEDGHPQPIRSFREYSVAGPPQTQRKLPPHTYANAQALPASGPVQIFYFILPPPIEPDMTMQARPDPGINRGAIIVRAKRYIADYFRTMPAGTQVAIFAFVPGEGLHLVQGFTTDGARAVEAMGNITVQRLVTPNPVLSDPIAAANQIAAYVASIHGRKNLIWIDTQPLMITRDGGYTDPCGSSPEMTAVHRRMDLYDRFTQEEIAVYPLDPNGVHGMSCVTLRSEMVAEQTGGATSNSNDYKGDIAKIVDETQHFYTLSYVPTRPDQDGHFHPISIKVTRPGVHLRYRTGYNDEQPQPPDPILKQRMIQGPMRLGALPTTQLLFDLEVQPTPPSNSAAYATAEAAMKPANNSDRKTLEKSLKGAPYDVVFRLDPTQIAFSESPDGARTANLEFNLGAFDLYSNLVVARSQVMKIVLTPSEYGEFMKTPFRFYLPIPLPKGQLTLRAGLFDTVANTSGSFQLPLAVAKNPPTKGAP